MRGHGVVALSCSPHRFDTHRCSTVHDLAEHTEPSLFYGSRQVGALTETAYYRFVFWQGMAVPPPSERLITQHTAFSARYRTSEGLRLQSPPFDAFEPALRDPRSYAATQPLGPPCALRGFRHSNAPLRTPDRALNAALFEPQALVSKKPLDPHR